VKLLKSDPVLIYGEYTLLDKDNPDVYAYSRELGGKKMLVPLNFKGRAASAATGLDLGKAKVVLGNYATSPRMSS
jgi:oligo-1,6-glucosidase